MNKYQKVLSPFLGGAIGILLSGYFYYATNEQNYWLLPLGVLVGSALGYFLGNARNILKKRQQGTQRFSEKISENWELLCLIFSKKKEKVYSKTEAYFNLKTSQKIENNIKKALKAISHPVNKSLFLRTILSLSFLGVLGYYWIIFLDISFTEYEQINRDGFIGIFCLYPLSSMVSILFLIIVPIMRWMNTYETQSNFFSEWEKYGKKSRIIFQNITQDSILFLEFQLLSFVLVSLLLLAFFYAITIVLPLFVVGIISLFIIGYVNALKKYNVSLTFVTTILVTFTSYLIFNAYFSNQIIIWLVALSTGALSAIISVKVTDILCTRKKINELHVIDFLMEKAIVSFPVKVYRLIDPFIQKIPIPNIY